MCLASFRFNLSGAPPCRHRDQFLSSICWLGGLAWLGRPFGSPRGCVCLPFFVVDVNVGVSIVVLIVDVDVVVFCLCVVSAVLGHCGRYMFRLQFFDFVQPVVCVCVPVDFCNCAR